jgi:serine/threonine protein kinase
VLKRTLGRGANAEVWEAGNSQGDVVALKILLRIDPKSEPYRRFRDEITAVQKFADLPGVLPIIDFSLPDRPSGRNPAWLAMPVATLIRDALQEEGTLDSVIDAVASIAETLSLLAERGVYHRDIKPDNLYRFGDRWAVGDFGLVKFPEKEALTAEHRKLGPMHYLAPEMLGNPAAADGGPADVYSLAKTLWVLGAGQNYPPPGEQRTDRLGSRITDVVSHQRSYLLDRLVERATADDPAARPSMAEIATDLRAWLTVAPGSPPSPDLSDLAARVASTLGPGLREERMRESYEAFALAAFQKLYDTVSEFPERFLKRVGLQGLVTTHGTNTLLRSYLMRPELTSGTGESLMWESYATLPVTTPSPHRSNLWCAIGTQMARLILRVHCCLGGTTFRRIRSGPGVEPVWPLDQRRRISSLPK